MKIRLIGLSSSVDGNALKIVLAAKAEDCSTVGSVTRAMKLARGLSVPTRDLLLMTS